MPDFMDRIGRNEDLLSDLRSLCLTLNLNFDLSFSKHNQLIGPVDKVSPYSFWRIAENSKAVAS